MGAFPGPQSGALRQHSRSGKAPHCRRNHLRSYRGCASAPSNTSNRFDRHRTHRSARHRRHAVVGGIFHHRPWRLWNNTRTRQRKLFLSRSNSTDLMIIGEVNSSLFNTGCLRISSSVVYLDAKSGREPGAFGSNPQDDKGIVVAAIPPATAVEMNLRLFVFISVCTSHLQV